MNAQSERSRLDEIQQALLLAASDMDQATAAARALQSESDGVLARALETAMAVCYMRPFTKPSLQRLQAYIPMEGQDASLHKMLEQLRHEVYAHTGPGSGRTAFVTEVEFDSGVVVNVNGREAWAAFNRGLLPRVIDLATQLRIRFVKDAAEIQVRLDLP